jgi:hypothetical protein
VTGDDEPDDGAPAFRTRLVLFAVAFLVVVALVLAAGGEHTATARHFLRQLLRQLF